MRYSKYNIVIIGSGLSGLYLANRLLDKNNYQDGILLVSKDEINSGSTPLAQGGIVSVIPEINPIDSIESHIKDTIQAGCGLNSLDSVKLVSSMSSEIAQKLISYGVEFDRNDNNVLNFTLEAAHSHPRILHAKGDSTGRVIEEALVSRISNKDNIDIYTKTQAIELLIDKTGACRGLIVYNWESKTFETIYTNNVVIATGGIGQLYKNTTNPEVSTGDGIALAINAGCRVENMEYVQFHPTALYCKDKVSMPLVSESVRGEGAKLVDINGDYFVKNYHHLADLAPRDIVARSIKSQLDLLNCEHVNLDISQIGIENFRRRFPTITSLCEDNNIDISNGLIPVVPAEHYFMGGIKVNLDAQTSIENLYAIGECSSTGLHGANRLASNSLLECAVFAHRLANKLSENNLLPPKKYDEKIQKTIEKYIDLDNSFDDNIKDIELFNELKMHMSEYVGISRTKKGLEKAFNTVLNIECELKLNEDYCSRTRFELKNALVVAKKIIQAAIDNENSLGAHFRSDTLQHKLDKQEIIGNNNNDTILA